MRVCTLGMVLSTTVSMGHSYRLLSDNALRNLPDGAADFDIHTGALLAPILQPRVPGTPGSTAVLNHFLDFFRKTLPEWTVELQNSTSKTPLSGDEEVPFVNLIATRDPPGAVAGEVGRLVLAAHYDSKLTPDGFIGAIDSAAPCAMLMHVARSVNDALTKKWAAKQAVHAELDKNLDSKSAQGLQILLFDGEEAFVSWTHTDSLYGSRSLAETWERTMNPAMSTYRTPLSSIELMVLLDLLGAENPRVPSYYKTTHWAYKAMAKAESRLRSLGKFKSVPFGQPDKTPQTELFLHDAEKSSGWWMGGMIDDDHAPFMSRGVEVLHLIPGPFPEVWHKITDDGEHLDLPTVHDWAILVTAFTAEWMDLDASLTTDSNRLLSRAEIDKPLKDKQNSGHWSRNEL